MSKSEMNVDTIDDRRLHRYFDGDLSADEAERVRRAIDADPALRAKLDGLREVRAVVRESASVEMPISSDDLWSRIEASIGAEPSIDAELSIGAEAPSEPSKEASSKAEAARDARPQLRAIEGGRAPRVDAPARTAPAVSPEVRRRRIAGIVVGGLALAAAVLLIVLRPGEPGPADAPIAEAPTTPEVEGPQVPEEIEETTVGDEVALTEVLEVDFGENSGAIFSVEGDDGQRYAVVWLADVQPKQTVE